ncbi:MAG TPA: hypothetical protein VJV03_14815, partial [Pyrinomonadaceae bacterium]|nr:hypothetical protein [Pyrinomonadaceae bacterium]
MSNGLKHLFKPRVKRSKTDTARLAARLAPLEEQGRPPATASEERLAGVSHETGAIVVDRNNLHVPNEMIEGGRKGLLGM